MKYYIFALSVLALFSTSSYADVDPIISAQKESGLEADHDTMVIKDADAERKIAKEQAAAQEQMTKEAKQRLDAVKVQKNETMEKAKTEIANFEASRKEAEKMNKKYKEETEKMTLAIKKLEESSDKARQAAKDAQDIATAGREELNMTRERKLKLEQENKQLMTAQNQAESEMTRLKEEYARLNDSIKELDAKIAANQMDLKKKQEMIARGSKEVAALQSKENQMKAALGIRPVIQPKPAVASLKQRPAVSQPAMPSMMKPAPLAQPQQAQPSNVQPQSPSASLMQVPMTTVAKAQPIKAEAKSDALMPAAPEVRTINQALMKTCDVDKDAQCQ